MVKVFLWNTTCSIWTNACLRWKNSMSKMILFYCFIKYMVATLIIIKLESPFISNVSPTNYYNVPLFYWLWNILSPKVYSNVCQNTVTYRVWDNKTHLSIKFQWPQRSVLYVSHSNWIHMFWYWIYFLWVSRGSCSYWKWCFSMILPK